MFETARCSLLTQDCGTIYFLFDDPKDLAVKAHTLNSARVRIDLDTAAEKTLRNYQVRKKRKLRCCIRIESAKENGQLKLILSLKGHRVEASQKHNALLACLHKNQGHVVSYKQPGLILGHKIRSSATTAYLAAICTVDQQNSGCTWSIVRSRRSSANRLRALRA